MKPRLALSLLIVLIALVAQLPVYATPGAAHGVFLPFVARDFTGTSSGWVTLLADSFESDSLAWDFTDRSTTGGDYRPARSTCNPRSGIYSVWMIGGGADGSLLPCGADYPNNADSRMIYGPFSLANATAAQTNWRFQFNNADGNDKFCYLSSKDRTVWRGRCLTVPTGGWSSLTYDFRDTTPGSEYNFWGEPQVWLMFQFVSDESDTAAFGAYVDDVVISKCITGMCPPLGNPTLHSSASGAPVELILTP
jgi:hypothetical protein